MHFSNVICLRVEKKWEHNEAVHQLFIDFKKAYDSVRREALYNILIEFGIPKKLVRLIKMYLTETYSWVRVGKNLSEMFPIRNGLKQGDALSPLLFNFALGYAIKRVQVNQAAHLLRSWVQIPPGAWIFVCCECRVLSGKGLCDELITRPEESYRLCCVVVRDLETSRIGAPYMNMTLVTEGLKYALLGHYTCTQCFDSWCHQPSL